MRRRAHTETVLPVHSSIPFPLLYLLQKPLFPEPQPDIFLSSTLSCMFYFTSFFSFIWPCVDLRHTVAVKVWKGMRRLRPLSPSSAFAHWSLEYRCLTIVLHTHTHSMSALKRWRHEQIWSIIRIVIKEGGNATTPWLIFLLLMRGEERMFHKGSNKSRLPRVEAERHVFELRGKKASRPLFWIGGNLSVTEEKVCYGI